MTFKIEKNVKYPGRLNSQWKDIPLSDMEINDSVLVPIQRNQKEYLSLASYISRFNRNNQPKQFSMKTYPQEGVRIFRLEDSEVEDNQQVQSTRASDESTDTGQLQQRGERQVSDPVDRQPTQTNPVQIPSG